MSPPVPRFRSESGQALVLLLGMAAASLAGSLLLVGFGQALGGRSEQQRGADLAAMSAALSMRDDYPRLFEPPVLPNGLPNPRHLSTGAYLARARQAAVRGGARNSVKLDPGDVTFGTGFAPVRVNVRARGEVEIELGEGGERTPRVAVQARASAALSPSLGNPLGGPAFGSGGGYDGPHRYATELDLGPPAAYAWLQENHGRFGFIWRYKWEDWHHETPLAAKYPQVDAAAEEAS